MRLARMDRMNHDGPVIGSKRSRRLYPFVFGWGYLFGILLITALMYGFGDLTWWGTAILYGPRWLYLLPWPVLLVIGCFCRRPLYWIILTTAGLWTLYFVVGWVVPFQSIATTWKNAMTANIDIPSPTLSICIMTFNLDGQRDDLNALGELLVREQCDVVVLQEAPEDCAANLPIGWYHVAATDLVIAARWPIGDLQQVKRSAVPGRWPRPIALIATVNHPIAPFRVVNLHPYSPRVGLTTLLDRRTIIAPERSGPWKEEAQWRWAEHHSIHEAISTADFPLIVAGDFNVPVESRIYRRYWASYGNAFSNAGWGPGHTIRIDSYGLNLSTRIDHILACGRWTTIHATVKSSLASEHRPLLATLKLH